MNSVIFLLLTIASVNHNGVKAIMNYTPNPRKRVGHVIKLMMKLKNAFRY